MAKVRIGISGWRYPPWRGVFYPKDLVQRDELHYASRCFPTIELNGSFYSLQYPQSYARWYEDTPRGFVFAVKGPRFITHVRRLRGIEAPLANFFASGVFGLREKLGPILWQFPGNFKYDRDLFARFFDLLPRNTEAALKLARRRDFRMKGRCRLAIDRNRKLRHAIEIRHASFLDEDFVALLREHGIALVVADTAGKWPRVEDLTADFVYMRLHGDVQLYVSGYTDAALERWAARIRAWSTGSQVDDAELISEKPPRRRASRDVYCYFDNDAKVRAPFDAIRLTEILGLRSRSRLPLSTTTPR
ncbi:MAG TPA: DUF72 domain-containing protein [Rhodanobacteraceae bacterium]|nr:DUF72 domain-containing protein [Rhodanobacteraceae bacterium]